MGRARRFIRSAAARLAERLAEPGQDLVEEDEDYVSPLEDDDVLRRGVILSSKLESLFERNRFELRHLLALPPGTTLDVAVWDRNFDDRLYHQGVEGESLSATQLLGCTRVPATYHGGVLISLDHEDWPHEPFPVHVCSWESWYPLEEDGTMNIAARIEEGCIKCYGPCRGGDCTGLPPPNHPTDMEAYLACPIGWRGPMILWSAVEADPTTYCYFHPAPCSAEWDDEEEGEGEEDE